MWVLPWRLSAVVGYFQWMLAIYVGVKSGSSLEEPWKAVLPRELRLGDLCERPCLEIDWGLDHAAINWRGALSVRKPGMRGSSKDALPVLPLPPFYLSSSETGCWGLNEVPKTKCSDKSWGSGRHPAVCVLSLHFLQGRRDSGTWV